MSSARIGASGYNMDEMKVIVRYNEISLKGKNRSMFEEQLVRNIAKVLEIDRGRIERIRGQINIELKGTEADRIGRLGNVFGIAWYSEVMESSCEMEEIIRNMLELIEGKLRSGDSFGVRVKRADKSLPTTSMDVERGVGEAIRKASGAKVDLKKPDHMFRVSLRPKNRAYIYTEKRQGPGGLPVGTTGKVLALLSGGFDSIAASYSMAKRGARVDFLHFHVFAKSAPVIESKIGKIANKLSLYTQSKQIYLAPYTPFQMAVLNLPGKYDSMEVVLFRRLMVKVANIIAKRDGYQALVTGDSLGQVASQTMENLIAVDEAANGVVFRPLIGTDKKDIIGMVEKIGLDEEAAQEYKDCCSLIQKSPATRVKLGKVKEAEAEMKLNEIAEHIAQEVEAIPLNASS